MNYNPLGRSGLCVSEICRGAMTFGRSEGRLKAIAGLDQAAVNGIVGRSL